jgi:hypothetical protein
VDPDPAFQRPGYGSLIQSGSRVLMTKNRRKKAEYIFFLSNCNLLIPSPLLRTSKLQEKLSALKREYPALEKIKFINFFIFVGNFCPSGSEFGLRFGI